MFRNYLAAALRNLVRNRLYAAINIVGLAVGFAAALLIGTFVRDELTFERFIPGHDEIYRLSFVLNVPGQGPMPWEFTPARVGGWVKEDFSEVQYMTRISAPNRDAKQSVRRGDVESSEYIYWADPNLADVLPFPTVAGDLRTALDAPDSVVITRRMARKYFGRDDVIGETLEIDRSHPMTVTAVLEDLPASTHLATEIIGSALATYSEMARFEKMGLQGGATYTYLRFVSGAAVENFVQSLPAFLDRRMPPPPMGGIKVSKASEMSALSLVPITDIHFRPSGHMPMKPAGNRDVVIGMAAVALLIVLVAAINFVNLMTAKAARRATEVGVRKCVGGKRSQLFVQFIGESIGYAALALGLGLLLAESGRPFITTLLESQGGLHAGEVLAIALFALTIGALAGFYPAVVLSAFSPSHVLRAGNVNEPGSGRLRRALVGVQFSVLIILLVITGVVYQQTDYALKTSLNFTQGQVLLVETNCSATFRDQALAIPGVLEATCSAGFMKSYEAGGVMAADKDGNMFAVMRAYIDNGFLQFHGINIIAGRSLDQVRAADVPGLSSPAGSVLINESAMRHLGYVTPGETIGKTVTFLKAEIVGVVPDSQMGSLREAVLPTAYSLGTPRQFKLMHLRVAGDRLPEVVRAIDALWSKAGDKQRPITRFFFDQYVNDLYAEYARQGRLFAVFAGVAIFLACLGLFGLSAFTAEQRTKEIGVRKSMGARTEDVLRLLLWQFVKPVLWANVIAWPVGYFVMRRWLESFAYRIDLSPWIFLGASALALLIAIITVAGHAVLVARAQPVTALRYE